MGYGRYLKQRFRDVELILQGYNPQELTQYGIFRVKCIGYGTLMQAPLLQMSPHFRTSSVHFCFRNYLLLNSVCSLCYCCCWFFFFFFFYNQLFQSFFLSLVQYCTLTFAFKCNTNLLLVGKHTSAYLKGPKLHGGLDRVCVL